MQEKQKKFDFTIDIKFNLINTGIQIYNWGGKTVDSSTTL